MTDDPRNIEYQSLLEAEALLEDLEPVRVPVVERIAALTERAFENLIRHERSNYHALLEQIRARGSSVRTKETAILILRSRARREIVRLHPWLAS